MSIFDDDDSEGSHDYGGENYDYDWEVYEYEEEIIYEYYDDDDNDTLGYYDAVE